MLFMVQYFKRKHLGFIFEYARYKLELLVMLHSMSLFKLCILTHLSRKKKLYFFIQCLCPSGYSIEFLFNDIGVILLAMHEVTFHSESALQIFALE